MVRTFYFITSLRNSTISGDGKCIHARTNLNGCYLLFTPHSTYSYDRLQCHSSFRDLSSQSCGDDYGCGRVCRDGHSKLKLLAIDLPSGGNLAIERLIGSGGEGQSSSWLRLE